MILTKIVNAYKKKLTSTRKMYVRSNIIFSRFLTTFDNFNQYIKKNSNILIIAYK